MNSTPADAIALTIFSAVSSRPPSGPSDDSRRLTVGIDTSEDLAKSSCDQPSSARAALICRIDTLGIDFLFDIVDTSSIYFIANREMEDRNGARLCQRTSTPPLIYRRVGCPDHHGGRRGGAAAAVAGEARRGRAGGPV